MPATIAARRLDHDSVPLQLWHKAKRLGVWDPAALDFDQDRRDWKALDAREQDLLLRLTAQFVAGEESVTTDLLPLLHFMAQRGRLEEELFLTAYLWEESKHVEGFARFLEEVVGTTDDLSPYLTPAYRRHFEEEQPRAMRRLWAEDAPEALADACVTYQVMTEGVWAETGYHAYQTTLARHDILPGMQALVRKVQRDESRHVAFGLHLLSGLLAEHGEALWEVVEARMNALLPLVFAHIGEVLAPYDDPVPLGVEAEVFLEYGLGQFQKRLARLERARNRSADEVRDGRALL